MRWIPGIAASLAVALALPPVSGCSEPDRGPRHAAWRPVATPGGEVEGPPRRGGTLRYSTYQSVRSLDPAISYDEISIYVLHEVYDTLISYEPVTPANRGANGAGNRLVPQLAERYDLAADGRTYRFTLRPGVQFSDGQPLVAGDFVYALERVLRMADSPFVQFLQPIAGAAEVSAGKAEHCRGLRAVDDRHLEIELSEPDASFLYVLAMTFATPLKRSFVERVGKQIRREVLGTGPFLLAAWSEGERVVMRRNPRYWNPALPYLDALIQQENIPRETGFLMFQAGELDTFDRPSSADYVWLAGQADWAPYILKGAGMNAYGEKMNTRMKPFDDVRVRRAMNYAVDKQSTVKLANGRAVPSHGILPPGMFGRDDSLPFYPHDPARARALLAEAGYPDGFEVEYVTLKDEQTEKIAAQLQADLAEVGVRVKIILMSFPTWQTATGRPDGPALAFTSWFMDYPDPSDFVDVRFHSRMIAEENSNNDAFYSNPALDALMDAARREIDPAKREAMYHRIERILYDDCPWLWHYHQLLVELRQPYVMNYAIHPVWIRDYRETWLDLGPNGERKTR